MSQGFRKDDSVSVARLPGSLGGRGSGSVYRFSRLLPCPPEDPGYLAKSVLVGMRSCLTHNHIDTELCLRTPLGYYHCMAVHLYISVHYPVEGIQ